MSQPNDKKIHELLFKDGLYYSIAMANLAFFRLRADLLALSQNDYSRRKAGKEILAEGQDFAHKVSALSNAWQIVDSVHRLRKLLKDAPSIRRGDTECMLFVRQTENVEHLRNNIQHLSNNIGRFVLDKLPAWGVLNWAAKLDESDERLVFSLVPGALFERTIPFLNPAGRMATIPIGLITLASDTEICLSDVVEIHISKLADWLNKTMGIDCSLPAQCLFASVQYVPNTTNPAEAHA